MSASVFLREDPIGVGMAGACVVIYHPRPGQIASSGDHDMVKFRIVPQNTLCWRESNATVPVTTRHARRSGVNFKLLLSVSACVAHCVACEASALAQQPARMETLIPERGSGQTMAPTQTDSPSTELRHFAFTLNPLNLVIGRYGFNFEYQPVVHHCLVVTPHYDHAVADTMGEARITDHLDGAGAEIGYRYYTGAHGFEGFSSVLRCCSLPTRTIPRQSILSSRTTLAPRIAAASVWHWTSVDSCNWDHGSSEVASACSTPESALTLVNPAFRFMRWWLTVGGLERR